MLLFGSECPGRDGLRLGRDTLVVILGIALCAFAISTFITFYGIFASAWE